MSITLRRLTPALLIGLTLSLAACGGPAAPDGSTGGNTGGGNTGGGNTGGGSTGGGSGQTYTKMGYIDVSETVVGARVDVSGYGAFFTSQAVTATGSNPYASLTGTCVVSDTTGGTPQPTPGTPITSLDAGDHISLTSSAGTFGALPRHSGATSIDYFSDESAPLPATLPTTALTADVPGAANVPAMKVTLPTAKRLTLTAPGAASNYAVTPDTTFTWSEPSNDASTVVLLAGSAMSASKVVVFACYAPDTGSFAFPAAAKQALAAKGFTSGTLSLGERVATATTVHGDVLVQASVSRLTMYGADATAEAVRTASALRAR
ncbi:hypothetical protein [Deinococcus pimensis]|uniref:hypothetical protein n=1 Tax=Deinococcus pimensis TaxID=309888 RepID=UPI00048240AC|nr:hypothetical protein [Deinococcus pimensis]